MLKHVENVETWLRSYKCACGKGDSDLNLQHLAPDPYSYVTHLNHPDALFNSKINQITVSWFILNTVFSEPISF